MYSVMNLYGVYLSSEVSQSMYYAEKKILKSGSVQ